MTNAEPPLSLSISPAAAVRAALAAACSRLRAAYRIWPDRGGWRFSAGQAVWLLPLLAACGWIGRFVHWQPALGGTTWGLIAIAFFFPALAEESLFRAALIRPGPASPWRGILVSALVFTAWHPLQARLYWVPWHGLARNPAFLAAILALGIACGRIFARTGSIWPCLLLHWLVVAVWKALFGAPLSLPHF
jgi:predicted Abi (CAAX) family protease